MNLNRGGVPKPPVDGTIVRALGLDGDGHNEPDIHGGPTAAVCLYPQEAVERVRADGHQSFPGSYGENLTLLGIDWAGLRDGDRLELGDDGDGEGAGPLLELTQFAAPCATQSHWFVEGRIARISHKVRPEDARWYARVLREGPVAPGMAVRVVRERLTAAHPARSAAHARRHVGYSSRDTFGGSMADTGKAAGEQTPATREALLELHAAARRRRNASALGSHEWEQASADVGRIEVEIASLERAMDPPRV